MDAIPIPEVEYHQEIRSLSYVQSVCEKYVLTVDKPCAVVKIDGWVCYAYMELDGTSEPVQCYKESK